MNVSSPRSVLVVSADGAFLALLGRLIESNSGLVLAGSTSETTALPEARRARPDLIVLDADPAGVEGAGPLLSKLSLVCEATLVALSSVAWPGSSETEALIDAGANAVFPKPSGLASLTLAGPFGVAFTDRFLRMPLRRAQILPGPIPADGASKK